MLIFKAGESNNTFLSFDVFVTNVEETIKVQSFTENSEIPDPDMEGVLTALSLNSRIN